MFPEKHRFSHRKGSIKNMFLKILQNSQENTCAHSGVFIVNFEHIKACNFIKKESLA